MGSFLIEPLINFACLTRPFESEQVVADRFEIVREIGEGGMGVVYEAFDRKLQEQCAIKAAKPGFQRLLSPELKAALKVRHHNVCLIKEIHTAQTDFGDIDFLTMELLKGQTLSAYLAAVGKISGEEALEISCQISAGLAEAHHRGIVHRDLKSGNIILCDDVDGSLRAVITDFGLAGEATSPAGEPAGTPAYMAPELWRGEKASRASDIYALGVMLYEMVAGRRPYDPEDEESAKANPSASTPMQRLEQTEAAVCPQVSLTSLTGTLKRYRDISAPPPPPSKWTNNLNSRWDSTILNCLAIAPGERIQDANDIVAALKRDRGTEVREAYLLHVKAIYWANKWTPDALQKALRYTQQAIEADPVYAEAYGDLAYLFALMGYHGSALPMDMFPKARAAAEKALELDDAVATAHAALAFTRLVFDWDFVGAEFEVRRALELDPKSSGGHYVYSQWCLSQGFFDKAIDAATRALEMDPLALPISFNLAAVYFYSRRYEEAIEHLKKMRELDPTFSEVHSFLAIAYARNGMYEEALNAAGPSTNEATNRFRLGIVNAIAGKEEVARNLLHEFRGQETASPVLAYRLAGILAQLGDVDDAFEYLNRALLARAGQMVFIKVDSGFDRLHGDVRWLGLLRRVGFITD